MVDQGSFTITEEINKVIKSVAQTITRTKLTDKIRSDITLSKAGLCCLNEATASEMATLVWKCKQEMNPLGVKLFSDKPIRKHTRSAESKNICPPVPGFKFLPSNLMAKVWNSVPELQAATTLSAAKIIAKRWAQSIPR